MTEGAATNGTAEPANGAHPAPASLPPADGIHPKIEHNHNPIDPEAFYSPEHLQERQDRQARRDVLKKYRETISALPINTVWEIPGR